jgi:hypothetical protein
MALHLAMAPPGGLAWVWPGAAVVAGEVLLAAAV